MSAVNRFYCQIALPPDTDLPAFKQAIAVSIGDEWTGPVGTAGGEAWSTFSRRDRPDVRVEAGLSMGTPTEALIVIPEAAWQLLRSQWAEVFFELADRLRSPIARTTLEGFHSGLLPGERVGLLTGLHWFQYLSPSAAAPWSVDYLRKGPFSHVATNDSGAVAFVIGDSPFAVSGRKAAASEYLGIPLRPVYGLNPATGERIVVGLD